MNKNIIGAIVAVVVVGGAAFYAGDVYGKGSTPMRGAFAANGAFMRGAVAGMRGQNGGFTAGQIISKDESSITLKMQDGSTKIILVGGSTQVMKTVSGTLSDLSVGVDVVVTGSANSDGSITAQNVQVRPAGMNFGSTTRAQ